MEMWKNLDQLKNDDRIKNILDKTKIIKSKWQPKNLKRTLNLGNTQRIGPQNAKI